MEKCLCDGDLTCHVCCKLPNVSDSECRPYLYESINSTKFLPPGFGCSNLKNVGVCDADGKCHTIKTLSPIVGILQGLLNGLLSTKFKIYLFDNLENFVVYFGLFISSFSSIFLFI